MWAKRYGKGGASGGAIVQTAMDSKGNVYVLSKGKSAAYIIGPYIVRGYALSKFNSELQVQWSRSLGTLKGASFALASKDNPVLVGVFHQAFKFEGQSFAAKGYAALLLQLDPKGSLLWTQLCTLKELIGRKIQLARVYADVRGHVFLLLYPSRGEGTFVLGTKTFHLNKQKYLLAQTNAKGQWIHFRKMTLRQGFRAFVRGTSIFFVSVYNGATATLDTHTLKSGKGLGLFALKLNTLSMQIAWAKTLVGPSSRHSISLESMAVTSSGTLYLSGSFSGSVQWGSRPILQTQVKQAFVVSTASNGDIRWAQMIQSKGFSGHTHLSAAGPDSVWFVTRYRNSVTLGTKQLLDPRPDLGVDKQRLLSIAFAHLGGTGAFSGERTFSCDTSHQTTLSPGSLTNIWSDPNSKQPILMFNYLRFWDHSNALKRASKGAFALIKIDSKGRVQKEMYSGRKDGILTLHHLLPIQKGHSIVSGSLYNPLGWDYAMCAGQRKKCLFVMRLNEKGETVWWKWIRSVGFRSQINHLSVTPDQSAVLLVGDLDGASSLGQTTLIASKDKKTFVAQIDAASGRFNWSKLLQGDATVNQIQADRQGHIYIAGRVRWLVFDSFTVKNESRVPNGDVFVAKLDASGRFMWAKSFGGVYATHMSALAIDSNDNVLIAGTYQFTFFERKTGSRQPILPQSSHNEDGFVFKWSPQGSWLWKTSFSTGARTYIRGLAIHPSTHSLWLWGRGYQSRPPFTGSFVGTFGTLKASFTKEEPSYVTEISAKGAFRSVWTLSPGIQKLLPLKKGFRITGRYSQQLKVNGKNVLAAQHRGRSVRLRCIEFKEYIGSGSFFIRCVFRRFFRTDLLGRYIKIIHSFQTIG